VPDWKNTATQLLQRASQLSLGSLFSGAHMGTSRCNYRAREIEDALYKLLTLYVVTRRQLS